jgi:hypothetical protein
MAEEILKIAEKAYVVQPVKHAGAVMKLGTTVSRIRFLRAPRFKKAFTLFYPLPWDRLREHLAGLSAAQTSVNKNFAAVSKATAGWKLSYRLTTIAKALKGANFGGVKRAPGRIPTSAEIAAALRVVGK